MNIITKEDLIVLSKVIPFLAKHEQTDETQIDWENVEMQNVIGKLIHNLENQEHYFKKLPESDTSDYYDAVCGNCGWFGSSQFLLGGAPIADTGDYSDVACPVCEGPIE